MRRTTLTVLLVLALLAGSCSDDSTVSSTDSTTSTLTPTTTPTTTTTSSTTTAPVAPVQAIEPYSGYVSELYDDPAVWICWPGADDVCSQNNDLTLVDAAGAVEVVPFEKADDAAIDCFYAYPTISADQTPNSDLIADPDQEIFTTRSQAARYGSVCDIYAPVYRQNTLASMLGAVEAPEGVSTFEIAYADVLDAWKHYITTANGGRGVMLLGHSQGAGLLGRLIAEEIDGVPELQERLVAAHLLGSSVTPGVDGSFSTVPGCSAAVEIGCVVSYATFRATAPPPDNSFFGRSRSSDVPALCTNPGDLDGGPVTLQPEYLVNAGGGALSGRSPFADPDVAVEITTPWIGYPEFLVGTCVDDGTFGYLEIEILTDPGARVDDIGGDLSPEWGLHLADAQVAMGDLVALAARQAEVYVGS